MSTYTKDQLDDKFNKIIERIEMLKEQIFTQREPFQKDMRLVTERLEKGLNDLERQVLEVQITTAQTLDTQLKEERKKSDKTYSPILAWRIIWGLLALFGLAVGQKLVSLIITATPK